MALTRETLSAPFWSMSLPDAADALESSLHHGLTEEEARRRQRTYGTNSIERVHREGALGILLKQFTSPLILILVGAALVTLSISHYRDTLFILVAVLANALLGFYQEHKAERALAELKSYLRERARVLRDGTEHEIDASHLVPGDLIRLSQGDRVPGDARIVSENDLQIDEAILTGESLPVEKSVEAVAPNAELADQRSLLFAGTLVTQGVSTALVCRTGSATEFGKIATLVARAEHEATPLQIAIQKFSLRASIFLAALTGVVFLAGVSAGHSYLEMFLTSVAIAVAAIPEGLPVALTVILAVGVERMAKRKGVVRKLVAAEALGDVSVILTDKTGTLTMAKMELSEIVSLRGEEEEHVLERALINVNALIENPADPVGEWRVSGPIMEVALARAAGSRSIDLARVKAEATIEQSLPFNSHNKFSVSMLSENGRHRFVFLGAPDILIARSTLSGGERREMLVMVDKMAREGKRVLGVASKETHRDREFSLARVAQEIDHLVLEGLLAFSDPVRKTVPAAIARVESAGIRVVIVTGDHLGTAETIAREAGIPLAPGTALEALDLMRLDDEAFEKRLATLRVIARVSPLEKVRIVRALKKSGEVVAMTGDGVNDAPSIKEADVGVAMGSGTEVARSVADLVLLDDNFETIAAAVEEGRQIMSNIRKVIVYLLSTAMDGLILIGGSVLAGVALPLNALQILWVNFFSDSFPAVAFAFEKGIDGLSSRPRARRQLFDPLMRFLIIVVGLSSSALLLAIYLALLSAGFEETLVRTFMFACFGSYTLFVALSVRSLEKSIFSYPLFSNLYLALGILIGAALMLAAIYVPFLQVLFDTVALPPLWLTAVFVVGIVNIAAVELGKWLFRSRWL